MFLLFSLVAYVADAKLGQSATDLPFYCRVFRNLLADAQSDFAQMINSDVTVYQKHVNVKLAGDVDTSTSGLVLGHLGVEECDVSVTDDGVVTLELTKLSLNIDKMHWTVAQESWPHVKDAGDAKVQSTVSFKFAFNARNDEMVLSDFALNALDITILKADHAKWLLSALTEVMHLTRPLLSMVFNKSVKKMVQKELSTVQSSGSGCALVEELLPNADMTQVVFKTEKPLPYNIPVMGKLAGWKVGVDVESTHISFPEQSTMKCERTSFDGLHLEIEVSDVQTSLGFNWQYQKMGEGTWQPNWSNSGTGSADVNAGLLLRLNIADPSKTKVEINLPKMAVKLDAKSDAWLYKAMTWALTPVVRVGMETLGAKVFQHQLKECLEDPSCPQPHRAPTAALLETARRVVRSQ